VNDRREACASEFQDSERSMHGEPFRAQGLGLLTLAVREIVSSLESIGLRG
jgi:hypothetical protein